MSDLEAYYDRQIPDLCGVAEETIWANRKAAKLKTKALPRMEHHAGTDNEASNKMLRDKNIC